jgi:hypothetical protein
MQPDDQNRRPDGESGPPPEPGDFALPPEPRDLSRRASVIGRCVLYGLTVFLIFLGFGSVTSMLWLIPTFAENEPFVALHRFLLAGAGISFAFTFIVLFVVHRLCIPEREVAFRSLEGARVHVGLTAWNDEACIAEAVREFKAEPTVHKVIVVENNSTDQTRARAEEAGADAVVTETTPGYGACCMRALAEAADGADVVVLCEGDLTFCASDMPKFLAYLENCDLVLGTRATQELRATGTQMDWLINPANQIVAKLIQARFWGTRLTDVGCTYRAIRADAYHRLKGKLWVRGNHFSPHMYIEALKLRMRVIEIPIVFRKRGGISKGVGTNKLKAARVALRMLALLYRA